MNVQMIAAALLAAGVAASAGSAHAQYYAGPRPAYASGDFGEGCRRFTLAGANAGVTVLGVDIGAAAGLQIGLHDCRPKAPVAYAPPEPQAPPAPSYAPGPYYAPQMGYAYGAQAGYGGMGGSASAYGAPAYYGRPCGC